MLYVVQLEYGKYYIGFSGREHHERLLQHLNNDGSLWTKKYKPIDVIYVDDNGRQEDENKLTLEVMLAYGWWNCRGGKWCQIDMKYPPTEYSLAKGLQMFRVTSGQRFDRILRNICSGEALVDKHHGNINCERCGRNSHNVSSCFARTHLNGNLL